MEKSLFVDYLLELEEITIAAEKAQAVLIVGFKRLFEDPEIAKVLNGTVIDGDYRSAKALFDIASDYANETATRICGLYRMCEREHAQEGK